MARSRGLRASYRQVDRSYRRALALLAKTRTSVVIDAFQAALKSKDCELARRLTRIRASETREIVEVMMPPVGLESGEGVVALGDLDARFYGFTLCTCSMHCGHDAGFVASLQILDDIGATGTKAGLMRMHRVLAGREGACRDRWVRGGASELAADTERPVTRALTAVVLVFLGVLCGALFIWVASGTAGAVRAGLLWFAVGAVLVAPTGLLVRSTRRKRAWRWLSRQLGAS